MIRSISLACRSGSSLHLSSFHSSPSCPVGSRSVGRPLFAVTLPPALLLAARVCSLCSIRIHTLNKHIIPPSRPHSSPISARAVSLRWYCWVLLFPLTPSTTSLTPASQNREQRKGYNRRIRFLMLRARLNIAVSWI